MQKMAAISVEDGNSFQHRKICKKVSKMVEKLSIIEF